jgi:hypothetical protein
MNAVEFKSVHDKLTIPDLFLINGRASLAAAIYYGELAEANKRPKPGRPPKRQPEAQPRVVSCIVSATYPQSVQDQLRVPFKPLEGYRKVFISALIPTK